MMVFSGRSVRSVPAVRSCLPVKYILHFVIYTFPNGPGNRSCLNVDHWQVPSRGYLLSKIVTKGKVDLTDARKVVGTAVNAG